MCKIWLINYTCGHKLTERLSKCRATYNTPSTDGNKLYVACQGTHSLSFQSNNLCGDCATSKRESEIEEKLATFENGSSEWLNAVHEQSRELFLMSKAFPRLERKKALKPLKVHPPTRQMRGSLLKTEVRREDIDGDVDEMLAWEAYYDEWRPASNTNARALIDANNTAGSTAGRRPPTTIKVVTRPSATRPPHARHLGLAPTLTWGAARVTAGQLWVTIGHTWA